MNGKLAENWKTFANKRKGIHQQRKEIQQRKRRHGCQRFETTNIVFEATKTGLEWLGIKQYSYDLNDLKSPKWRFDHQYGDTDPANKRMYPNLKMGLHQPLVASVGPRFRGSSHFWWRLSSSRVPATHPYHSWIFILSHAMPQPFDMVKICQIMAYHVYFPSCLSWSYFPLWPQRSQRSNTPSGYPKDRWTHPLSQPSQPTSRAHWVPKTGWWGIHLPLPRYRPSNQLPAKNGWEFSWSVSYFLWLVVEP